MSLGSTVIASFKTGTYSVTRKASGSWSNGVYTAGATSSVNIDASIQPLTGRDLKSLGEGQHAEDMRVLYTTSAIYTRTPSQEPDSVSIGGEAYTVLKVESWPSYYRAIIARQARP